MLAPVCGDRSFVIALVDASFLGYRCGVFRHVLRRSAQASFRALPGSHAPQRWLDSTAPPSSRQPREILETGFYQHLPVDNLGTTRCGLWTSTAGDGARSLRPGKPLTRDFANFDLGIHDAALAQAIPWLSHKMRTSISTPGIRPVAERLSRVPSALIRTP